MNHRFCSALTLLVALGFISVQSTVAKPNNILFIYSDDHAPGMLGVLGHPDVKTPHIDQLYREGFHFSQAYNMGGLTPAVCLPSRAMLMSGKSLFRAPRQLNDGVILPEALRQGGFTTFVSGKWHNGADSLIRGFDQAEAVFLGGAAGRHVGTPVNHLVEGRMVPYEAGDKHSSELFTDAAIAFLEKQKTTDKPFFCYIPFTAPHTPHDSPEEFRAMYDPTQLTLPENFKVRVRGARPQAGWRLGAGRTRGGAGRGGRGGRGGGGANLATEESAKRSYANYYAIITHMDRLLEAKDLRAENAPRAGPF